MSDIAERVKKVTAETLKVDLSRVTDDVAFRRGSRRQLDGERRAGGGVRRGIRHRHGREVRVGGQDRRRRGDVHLEDSSPTDAAPPQAADQASTSANRRTATITEAARILAIVPSSRPQKAALPTCQLASAVRPFQASPT